MKKPFVRSPYNYVRRDASAASALDCSVDEGRTQQQFKDECDINVIVKRFGLTGMMPEGLPGNFGDFSDVDDYQTALNRVRESGETFMDLPSDLRKRFHNDPFELMKFLGNDANRVEAEKLGLVPVPAPIVKAPPMEVVVLPGDGNDA